MNRILESNKVKIVEKKDSIRIEVKDAREVMNVLKVLKGHTGIECKGLIDIICIDYKEQLRIVYEVISIRYSKRVSVEVDIKDEIQSVGGIWKGSNWLEREVFDMYGVYFVGHQDLRRLLTDYGFRGHPLRKEFNKSSVWRYNEEMKLVCEEDGQRTKY